MKAWELAHIVTHYLNQKGDNVSHKKLQKLLYYVESWYLVNFDTSIIDEEFQAWVHGPVIPELYHELKKFGFNNIRVINDEDEATDNIIKHIIHKNGLGTEDIELIEDVLNQYGSLTSFELELLTHNEPPWIEARNDFPPHMPCRNIISKDRMKEYYTILQGK